MSVRHLRLKNLLLSSSESASKIRTNNKQETTARRVVARQKGSRLAVRVSMFQIEDTLFEETSEMQRDKVAAALGSARSST
jgi:hypothetical protein